MSRQLSERRRRTRMTFHGQHRLQPLCLIPLQRQGPAKRIRRYLDQSMQTHQAKCGICRNSAHQSVRVKPPKQNIRTGQHLRREQRSSFAGVYVFLQGSLEQISREPPSEPNEQLQLSGLSMFRFLSPLRRPLLALVAGADALLSNGYNKGMNNESWNIDVAMAML